MLSKALHKPDCGLLIIRLGLGACMLMHGLPKLMAGPDGNSDLPGGWRELGGAMGNFGIHFAPVLWGFIGALTEALGGLLFAVGFGFRVVCAFLVIQMVVAINAHLHMPAPYNTFGQGYSHALELGFVFLGMLLVGPGRLALDNAVFKKARVSA